MKKILIDTYNFTIVVLFLVIWIAFIMSPVLLAFLLANNEILWAFTITFPLGFAFFNWIVENMGNYLKYPY